MKPPARPAGCQTPEWMDCGKQHLEAHVQMQTRFDFIFGFKSYAEAVAVVQPDWKRIRADTVELRYMMGGSGSVRSKICKAAEACEVDFHDIGRIECVGATVILDGQSASNSAGMFGCPKL